MKNNVHPCKPQFYYIKVGFKGIKIIKACFRDCTGCCGSNVTWYFERTIEYENRILYTWYVVALRSYVCTVCRSLPKSQV